MAGSLNHMIDDDGRFTMETLEGERDCREALEECHQIIARMLAECVAPENYLREICDELSFPVPRHIPVIQPELHGAESAFRPDHTNKDNGDES
jgi:hypothetical protein